MLELFKNTFLFELLGHVSWVPEVNFSLRPSTESQVILPLGPLDTHNCIFRTFHMQKLLFSSDIVNSHKMVVVLVHASDIAAAGTQRYGLHTARASRQHEIGNLLKRLSVPDVDGGRVSDLASHNQLAVKADVQRQNVVAVAIRSLGNVFGSHVDFFASIDLLVAIAVLNDCDGGRHESDFTLVSVF